MSLAKSSEGERFRERWARRALTVPGVLLASVLGVVLSPLLCAAAVAYDLVRRRRRLPVARTLLFVLWYLVIDSVEVVVSFVFWVRAGFGTRLASPASIARHQRLQRWSIDVLEKRARQTLGVQLVADAGTEGVFETGPVIVCSRHLNLLDAAVPIVLLHRHGLPMRAVIMAEMLMDPGFDLLYRRLGSVFISRDQGVRAHLAVTRLAHGITPRTAAVIFPEGRLFRPELVAPLVARIGARDPARAARLSSLVNVLPPRPGGLGALLDAIPGADVVFVAYRGFEAMPRFTDFAREAPLREPVQITAWRCPRASIPEPAVERTAWLDAQWQRLDDWISSYAG